VVAVAAFFGFFAEDGPLRPAPAYAHTCGPVEWTVDSSQVPQAMAYAISAAGLATNYEVASNTDPAVASITPATFSGTDGLFSITAEGFGAGGNNQTVIQIDWAAPSAGESGLCFITVTITGSPPTPAPASLQCQDLSQVTAQDGVACISLTPKADTNAAGQAHTVIASVTVDGAPLSGVCLYIVVIQGPNMGRQRSGVTDGAGEFRLTYPGNGPGTDMIGTEAALISASCSGFIAPCLAAPASCVDVFFSNPTCGGSPNDQYLCDFATADWLQPTETPAASPTSTATATQGPTDTPSGTAASITPLPSPGANGSATPTATPTGEATSTATPTAAPTAVPGSPTASPTETEAPAGGNDSRPDIVRSVPRAGDLSGSLGVILTNILFGGFTLVLMLLSAEIFNQTIEENEDEIRSWFDRISGPFKGLLGLIGDVGRLITDGRGVAGLLAPIVLLALAALLYGLEEPGYGINEQSAVIFISFLAAFAVLTYVYDGGQLLMTNGFGIPGSIRLFPIGIFVALFCIALTRLLGFQPGIIFGFIAAHTLVAGSAITRDQEGRQILFPALVLLTVCAAAFLLLGPARDLATDNDSIWAAIPEGVAVGIFVGGLEGTFFQMVPLKFMDGHRLWAWSKPVWLGVTGVATFLFWHILLNAERQSYDALSATTPALAFLLMGICFGATLAVYLFFRIKTGRGTSSA